MPRGRTPQHDNIRALKGDPNKDRYNNGMVIDPIDELPTGPDWWDVKHVQFYEKKAAQLMAHKMLTELDIEFLQEYVNLRLKLDKMWQLGELPPSSTLQTMRGFVSDLGLSPMSRQKFKVTDGGDKTKNKYAKSKPKK